jgi:integrase
VEERLTTEDFQSFVKSGRALEIMKIFDTMAADSQATADVKTFSAMRDYLLLRVMIASGQRCGAASNLTIQAYADGVWTESDGSLS